MLQGRGHAPVCLLLLAKARRAGQVPEGQWDGIRQAILQMCATSSRSSKPAIYGGQIASDTVSSNAPLREGALPQHDVRKRSRRSQRALVCAVSVGVAACSTGCISA